MPAITTGVDQLRELIDAQARISVADAAKKLHSSPRVIEDWASLLEDAGFITIEYKLAKTYLVRKEVVPKEQQKNVNALLLEKREFEDRTGGVLSYLDRLEDQIKALQPLITRKISSGDVKKLKSLETEHKTTDKQLIGARSDMMDKFEKIAAHLQKERKDVKGLFAQSLNDLITANQLIELEEKEAAMLDRNEEILETKLKKVSQLLDKRLVKLMANKQPLHAKVKGQLKLLKAKAKAFHDELAKDQKDYDELKKSNRQTHAAVQRAHQQIIGKIKKSPGMEKASVATLQKFLARRTHIANVLTAIANEEASLRRVVKSLLGKGESLPLTDQSRFESAIARLNKDLAAVAERRGALEKQVKELVTKLQ
ncbi:hypothetical protein HY492_02885 [Candidatus Woesearchaeota archaeon]|nr:hypothetical protein [Candidatus Woesearchaeota archaeon]